MSILLLIPVYFYLGTILNAGLVEEYLHWKKGHERPYIVLL